MYTREKIKSTVEKLGYKYFTGEEYDVNIIGVRNSETKNKVTNSFDDKLTVSYNTLGEKHDERKRGCNIKTGSI
mgnify:CR=1 FL=1